MQLVKNAAKGYVVEIYYSEEATPSVVSKMNDLENVRKDEPAFIGFTEGQGLPVVFENKSDLLPLIIDSLADLSFEDLGENAKQCWGFRIRAVSDVPCSEFVTSAQILDYTDALGGLDDHE